jgi:Transposase DDE domain
VCRNPLVAADRSRKREELLQATERGLREIAARVTRGTLSGAGRIGLAVGPALTRYRVKKDFEVKITDTTFTYERNTERIEAETALDGIYVLSTSVPDSDLDSGEVVRSYKQLKQVERAFRRVTGPELQIRLIHHRLEDRVRTHVFLCMLAYYLTWHLRHASTPVLYADGTPSTVRPGR